MSWGTGQQLNNNRYEIVERIGTGGFGVTYKALDRKTANTVVAIKTLNEKRQRQANFNELQDNFLNEALSLAKCSHPHVIRVERVFSEGQVWAMVMEYIDGETLEDRIIDKGRMTETQAVEIIQKIGSAVSYVHSQQLLHRDIKPANILIRPNGEPVLIDFGLAREFVAGVAKSMTSDRTPHYSPPEQAKRRGEFSPPLDVYSLAATLYTCVTGDLPALAEIRVVRDSLIEPKEINPQLSDRVNQAIIQGMALKSEERSSTVEQWLELLKPVPKSVPKIEYQPQPSPPPTPTPILEIKNKSRVPSPPTPVKLVHQKFSFEVAKIELVGGLFGKKAKIDQQTKQGECIIEDLGNGVKLEMVYIPGGSFLMGQTEAEKRELIKLVGEEEYQSWYACELPQHLVNVPAFYMGKYPITQSQYLALMGNNPSHFQGGDLPVESVSWLDAQEFCDRLNAKTGKKYRLPSEAEWEYAARGGTTTPFHFGEIITTDVANFNGNYTYGDAPKGKYLGKTNPVGSYKVANDLGLYDLHGNVWEWCLDEWVDNYKGAPTDGSARGDILSRDKNKLRLLRGGSCYIIPWGCRSAFRFWWSAVSRVSTFGFRVVFPQTL
jgi:formylglycine-generating enzyme required for sulfatase activity/tRNA A-37 threonylcarbamoyl transferase component Bud32